MNSDEFFIMWSGIIAGAVKAIAVCLVAWAAISAAERVAFHWIEANKEERPL